jgi:hypothetical protein
MAKYYADLALSKADPLNDPSLPDQLYLIKRRGEWPTYAEVNEAGALHKAAELAGLNADVMIYRVELAHLTRLEVQEEVIRRQLVPYGDAVHA